MRVYVTLWDPRQVALHMEAGTVEPISATGEHGSGMIPRVPEVMDHVVAAFNGGFQAQHGEYGMQANGIEYLPPKPYAATVVELRDGSNGFGAWPASAAVPDDVIGIRQNLTALVQDGKFNPWGRTWWGGAPPGWPDQIHTARSAICLTREGFAGYFYSSSISAEDLAQGMLAARCAFGIHLDMNPGHAGFEFYDVAPEGRADAAGPPAAGGLGGAGQGPRHARIRVPRAPDDPGHGAHAFPAVYPARSARLLLPHFTLDPARRAARAGGGCGRRERSGRGPVAHARLAAARLPLRAWRRPGCVSGEARRRTSRRTRTPRRPMRMRAHPARRKARGASCA